MTTTILQRGMRGDEVRALQMKLHRLGFDLAADGVFGARTEHAVRRLQQLFGHDDDGVVRDATRRLIETELQAAWNAKLPNAEELAMRERARVPPDDEPLLDHDRAEARAQALIDELPSAPQVPDALHTAVPGMGVPSVAPGASRPAGAPGRQPSSSLPARAPEGRPTRR